MKYIVNKSRFLFHNSTRLMNSQIYSRVILAREYEAIMDLKKNCSKLPDDLPFNNNNTKNLNLLFKDDYHHLTKGYFHKTSKDISDISDSSDIINK